MPQILNVNLDYNEIIKQAKRGHSSFFRSKKGEPFFGITIWVNDEPDQYNHDIKVTLNTSKEKKGTEEKVYIGNGSVNKASGKKTAGRPAKNDDGLPF